MLSLLTATPAPVITAELVEPIVEMVSSSVVSLLPAGMAIMAIMVGVRMIPRLVHMFL